MSKVKWESVEGHNNVLLRGDGFSVSYNHNMSSDLILMSCNVFASCISGEPIKNVDEETALIVYGHNECEAEYYILDGDFRKDYEKAILLGLTACLDVYNKNKNHRSFWSTDG